MAPIEATVSAVVGDEKSMTDAWVEAGFNAKRAADQVWASAAGLRVGLSDAEQQYCRIAIEALFRALQGERKLVEATEAEFRRRLLERVDQIIALPDRLAEADRLLESAMLALPVQAYHPGLSPPGVLLRADTDRPVPFHGRRVELDELVAWSTSQAPLAVRLITGAGGMGKTRLLIELSRRLQRQGWRVGFLDARAPASDGLWSRLARGAGPLLVVIDYAENRRAQVGALLRAVQANLGQRPVRLMLLARAADDWWDAMRREGGGVGDVLAGPGTSRMALRGLASDPPARRDSYALAVKHFSAILGKPVVAAEPDFGDASFERALILHMSALAAVEGVQVKGEQGILGHALDRERRFWSHRIADLGLVPLYERAILRAMAILTLAGGSSNRQSAMALVSQLAIFAGEKLAVIDAIVGLLHETYQGDRWIDPLLPDLLGEHLVQVALEDGETELLDIAFGKAQ
jgi:hypothetical protein